MLKIKIESLGHKKKSLPIESISDEFERVDFEMNRRSIHNIPMLPGAGHNGLQVRYIESIHSSLAIFKPKTWEKLRYDK